MDLPENIDGRDEEVDKATKCDAAVASVDKIFIVKDALKELSEEEVASHIALLEQEEVQMAANIQRERQVNKLLELTLKAKNMKDKLRSAHEQCDTIKCNTSGCSGTAKTSHGTSAKSSIYFSRAQEECRCQFKCGNLLIKNRFD